MTKQKQVQFLLITGAVVLSVLLYFAPKKTEGITIKEPQRGSSVQTIESFVKNASDLLTPELKQIEAAFLSKASGTDKKKWLDSLVIFWDKVRQPDIASYYYEKSLINSTNTEFWLKAGDRYYYSVRFTKNTEEIPLLYKSASRCYETCLRYNSNLTDAKIMLAACYVEAGEDPMKGINLLKEVEKTDSNNIKLQLNFAFFSVKSQQWEKAIKRFEKVLQIDSTYLEAYLHLADAYEQQGDKIKTIEMLEKYVSNTNDITAKQEIKKYIQQLKAN